MSKIIPVCEVCGRRFRKYSSVVVCNNIPYHKDCIKVYPLWFRCFDDDGVYLGGIAEDDIGSASKFFEVEELNNERN